jgi:hypothetical protein
MGAVELERALNPGQAIVLTPSVERAGQVSRQLTVAAVLSEVC